MKYRRLNFKAGFFWQGLLIVLPVAMLAGAGLLSLRKDRQLARHEAAQRAQAVADELLARLWADVLPGKDAGPSAPGSFRVDAAGQLLDPPPIPALPVPQPLDPSLLDPPQAELWQAAQRAADAVDPGRDAEGQAQAWRDFLASRPPRPFAGRAAYALALAYNKLGETQSSADQFQAVMEQYPDVLGDSGLPLGILAELKCIELNASPTKPAPPRLPVSISSFCSNLVHQPIAISPLLLERAALHAPTDADRATCQNWQRVWSSQETARAIHEAAQAKLASGAPLFWVSTAEAFDSGAPNPTVAGKTVQAETHDWLVAAGEEGRTNRVYRFHSEAQLDAHLAGMTARSALVPGYSKLGLTIAGKSVIPVPGSLEPQAENGDPKARPPEVLASAARTRGNEDVMRVSVYLVDPGALFQAQRARTLWFGALIAASALAALAGFLSAWRAFRRQLQLSEMKSNFVSSVSHELRAPIASVRLMAESLERGKITEDTKRRDYFRFISQECRRLSALIENVLDFSRIEQGRKRYDFEPTDLLALTQTTARLMEPYAAERGISVTVSAPGAPAQYQTCVDGKAIQQALVNLLDNAIKHSPKGQTVLLGLERTLAGGHQGVGGSEVVSATPAGNGAIPNSGRISLWVEDQGDGIPAAEHERIFERFYRLGSELRRETTGVGIGLSIVKHIVEGHSGRVIVRSAPGQGSRFTLDLPVEQPILYPNITKRHEQRTYFDRRG